MRKLLPFLLLFSAFFNAQAQRKYAQYDGEDYLVIVTKLIKGEKKIPDLKIPNEIYFMSGFQNSLDWHAKGGKSSIKMKHVKYITYNGITAYAPLNNELHKIVAYNDNYILTYGMGHISIWERNQVPIYEKDWKSKLVYKWFKGYDKDKRIIKKYFPECNQLYEAMKANSISEEDRGLYDGILQLNCSSTDEELK